MQTSMPFVFFRVYNFTGFSLIVVSNAFGSRPETVRSLSVWVEQADIAVIARPIPMMFDFMLFIQTDY